MELFSFFSGARHFNVRLRQQRGKLLRVAYSWCHQHALADDLVQETYTRAMEKQAQLRDPRQFEPWLFAILTNCWRDHLRRLRPQEDLESLEESIFNDSNAPEASGETEQIVVRVQKAVARLPMGQRQVLTLVDLEEFSYAEVSAILQIPIGTVMSRLCRARQALKKELIEFDVTRTAGDRQLRRVK